MQPDWNKWFGKLTKAASWEKGWNGYNADPPNQVSVENARNFLLEMKELDCEPTRVTATAMGGIAICKRNGSKKVIVEFYNRGNIHSLFAEDAILDTMETRKVEMTKDGMREFILLMKDYLKE